MNTVADIDHYIDSFEHQWSQRDLLALTESFQEAPTEYLPALSFKLADHITAIHRECDEGNPSACYEKIENYRPLVHLAIESLLAYYINGEPRKEESEDVGSACIALLTTQFNAYAVVMKSVKSSQMKGLLAIVLHRLVSIQLYMHIIRYMMYVAIPDKEWLNLHRLFALAKREGLHEVGFIDEMGINREKTSVANLYSYGLLLGCSRTNQLSGSDILTIVRSIVLWIHHVEISTKPSGRKNEIVVDVSSGSAPNFRQFFDKEENSSFYYIQLEALLEES